MGSSEATASTAASTDVAGAGPAEVRDMKRLEKKLREISKLTERACQGEKLDALQLEKMKQKPELEAELGTLRDLAAARARDAAGGLRCEAQDRRASVQRMSAHAVVVI